MDGKSIQINEDIQQNELLTVREVAAYLRVGRVTVWRWCKDGVIPAFRIGRNWRISRDDFLDFIVTAQASNSVSTNPDQNPHRQPVEDNQPEMSEAVLEKKESAVEANDNLASELAVEEA